MTAILINARREGYSLEECSNTMTVGQLIAMLSEFDEDAPVVLSHDGGYTFGSIQESDLSESDLEDEEF